LAKTPLRQGPGKLLQNYERISGLAKFSRPELNHFQKRESTTNLRHFGEEATLARYNAKEYRYVDTLFQAFRMAKTGISDKIFSWYQDRRIDKNVAATVFPASDLALSSV